MSSAPEVERFKGTNWEECNEFILAIRARALREGKQRDPAWMADFAAPLFSHKALRWHGRLPPDVRQDWLKLEVALFDRWPAPEDDDELAQRSVSLSPLRSFTRAAPRREVEPTPAAAPSLNSNNKANRPLQGVLKLVVDGSDTNQYVKRPDPESWCRLTNDKNEALHIRCNSLSQATPLEVIDDSCHSWLIVQWSRSSPNLGDGSTHYAFIAYLDPDTLKSSWRDDLPSQLIMCTVLANGEVIPAWRKGDTSCSKITLSAFVDDRDLCLVVDPAAYGDINDDETPAKIFFESTD